MSIPLPSAGNHSQVNKRGKTNVQNDYRCSKRRCCFRSCCCPGHHVNVELMLVGLEMTTPTTTDIHVAMKVVEQVYYVRILAVVAVDGVDTETEFSGKAGIGIPVSEVLGVYGEVSFLTAEDEDDFGVGGKLGVSTTEL